MVQTKLHGKQVVTTPATGEVPVFEADGTMESGSAGAAAVAGNDTYVQFNDGGTMGATDGLTFEKTNEQLAIAGATPASAGIKLAITGSAAISNEIGAAIIVSGTYSGTNGDFRIVSPTANTGGGYKVTHSEAVSAALSGAAVDIEVNVPDGAKVLGCQLRVDTAVTGPADFNADYAGGVTQSIAGAIALAKNTKVNTMFDPNANTPVANAEVDVRLTSFPDFTAGVVRAIVYYEEFIVMDDNP